MVQVKKPWLAITLILLRVFVNSILQNVQFTCLEIMSDDFDNNEEDRGYEEELNFNDVFLTVWASIWMIPITIVFILLIKNRMDLHKSSSSAVSKKDKNDKKIWILGFSVCLCLYLREIGSVSSWICFVTTFDYSATSGSFISDIGLYAFWMFADTFLYLFFIYRLYIVYNPNNQNVFTVRLYWYIILLTLNLLYFVSLLLILIAWIIFDDKLYVLGHSLCLGLEVTMYAILVTLFSKPMINITINSRRSTETDYDLGTRPQDKILILLTRMNILSSVALLTTIFKRIFDISSYLYCPDECWLTFINYSLLAIDSFTNIFCILCSFTTGKKYYEKYCHCLHNIVLTKCIGMVIEQQINSELRMTTYTSNETTGNGSTVNSPTVNSNTSFDGDTHD